MGDDFNGCGMFILRKDSSRDSLRSVNGDEKSPVTHRYSGLIPVVAFLLVCTAGFLVSVFFPNAIGYLGCSRSNVTSGRIHALVTCAFFHVSLAHLLRVGASLLISTWFIADMLPRGKIWVLMFGSSVLGAILVCLMEKSGLFAGGVMITWGLAGAVLSLGTTRWRKLNLLRRVYLVFIGLCIVGMLCFNFIALSCTQTIVAAAAFVVVRFWSPSLKLETQAIVGFGEERSL
jgi:membrane associated rhomboid family serine protease